MAIEASLTSYPVQYILNAIISGEPQHVTIFSLKMKFSCFQVHICPWTKQNRQPSCPWEACRQKQVTIFSRWDLPTLTWDMHISTYHVMPFEQPITISDSHCAFSASRYWSTHGAVDALFRHAGDYIDGKSSCCSRRRMAKITHRLPEFEIDWEIAHRGERPKDMR